MSQIPTIIEHLRPILGDLVDDFVAVELSKIDERYVSFEHGAHGMTVSYPKELPELPLQELGRLLKNIADALTILFGPEATQRLIKQILTDIWG